MTEYVSLGATVKDGFKPADNWVSNGIKWLDDIQEFYRERVTLEKEFGTKLQQLAKKYQEKRIKRTSALSVGDNPAMTPGSLENASMTTWAKMLDDTKEIGSERVALSEELRLHVAEATKALGLKSEDFRKRHEILNGKLIDLRDKTYGDLRHQQKKYYDVCGVLEKSRQSGKQKNIERTTIDMNNAKNSYIVAINCANGHKRKYFHDDVPMILDSLQDLNQVRVQKLDLIWRKATELERNCLARQSQHLQSSDDAVVRNLPQLDTNMFIQHNSPNWVEPNDFGFEPCPIWHDVAELAADEPSRIYLQNNLTKARRELAECKAFVDNKRREIAGLERVKQQYVDNPTAGPVEDVLNSLLYAKTDLVAQDNRRNVLEFEVATVTQVLGNIDAGTTPHEFKSTTFAIPTTCDLCHHSIWGINSKGVKCKLCAYAAHKSCQMKVPANCTQVKGEKKGGGGGGAGSDGVSLGRTDTAGSNADSIYGVGRGRPSAGGDSDDEDGASQHSGKSKSHRGGLFGLGRKASGKGSAPTSSSPAAAAAVSTPVLYDYTPASAGEVAIKQGQSVTVLEGDDGQGWIKVRTTGGAVGLVPGGYVQDPQPKASTISTPVRPSGVRNSRTSSMTSMSSANQATAGGKKAGPPVAAKRGTGTANGGTPTSAAAARAQRQVRVLYDYDAATAEELSLRVGQVLVLLQDEQGDGWAKGELSGRTGIFPQAYTEKV
ncbi:Protein BZZ1 [Savitreella phatthalungensis]